MNYWGFICGIGWTVEEVYHILRGKSTFRAAVVHFVIQSDDNIRISILKAPIHIQYERRYMIAIGHAEFLYERSLGYTSSGELLHHWSDGDFVLGQVEFIILTDLFVEHSCQFDIVMMLLYKVCGRVGW